MKDKKIFSLLVLIILVVILIVFLLAIGWQTGFVTKENGEEGKKSSLKLIEPSTKETEQTTNSTTPTITGNVIKIGSSQSSGSGGSGGSSSGSSGTSGTNPSTNPPTNPPTSQATVELSINPSSSTQQKNNEFIINVDISSEEEIYAAEFELSFNSEILQLISITKGDFLNSDGANTYEVIKNESGKAIFASTRFNIQTGVSGQGNLATIKFKAVNTGKSDLILNNDNVKITDMSLDVNKFQVSVENGKITIT